MPLFTDDTAEKIWNLTNKQRTQAFQQYAKKYGYDTNTVRNMTSLKLAALKEYVSK